MKIGAASLIGGQRWPPD